MFQWTRTQGPKSHFKLLAVILHLISLENCSKCCSIGIGIHHSLLVSQYVNSCGNKQTFNRWCFMRSPHRIFFVWFMLLYIWTVFQNILPILKCLCSETYTYLQPRLNTIDYWKILISQKLWPLPWNWDFYSKICFSPIKIIIRFFLKWILLWNFARSIIFLTGKKCHKMSQNLVFST